METPSESPQLPSKGRRMSRPKLKIPQINMPNLNFQRQPEIPVPMTAGCAIPIGNPNGPFGLFQFYPTKASEFMNKRYENFKDFTKNTAKSGLSFGEKALFWLNGRVRQLSKKWFTHIFLFLVVFLYSLVGAVLFVTVEGTHENREKADIEKELNLFMSKVRGMAMERDILLNNELWKKNFRTLMAPYENQLLESFRHGVTPDEHKTWSFWNSMFYCGTIYTTIDMVSAILSILMWMVSVLPDFCEHYTSLECSQMLSSNKGEQSREYSKLDLINSEAKSLPTTFLCSFIKLINFLIE